METFKNATILLLCVMCIKVDGNQWVKNVLKFVKISNKEKKEKICQFYFMQL